MRSPTGLRLLAVSAGILATPLPLAAFPGDPRTIQGTIEWTPGPGGARFVVVRGDDGQYYSTDVSRLLTPAAVLNRGDRVVVVGREGGSPHEITATTVANTSGAASAGQPSASPPTMAQPGGPSTSNVAPYGAPATGVPAPGGDARAAAPASAPPAAGSPTATPPPTPTSDNGPGEAGPPTPRANTERTPTERLDGQVRRVSGNELVLRATDGREVIVQMPNIAEVLQPGDHVTMFGRPDGSRRFVATGFVHVEPAPGGSAPPGPRR
jgi:hypothetical protein